MMMASPMPALPAAAASASSTTGRQRETAREFEAQALGALLQPMFDGLGEGGAFGGGTGEAQWRPLLVNEYAKGIARAGGVGLAAGVLDTLLRMQEARETP